MSFKMEAQNIFKDKIVFKMSNVVFFYKVLSFLFFPEMSVLQVGFSNLLYNKSFQDPLH